MPAMFQFKIGDWVQHKQAKLHAIKRAERNISDKLEEALGIDSRYPVAMLIVGRIYEECPGGTQIHYTCRCGLGPNVQFHEMELEPYEV